MQRVCSVAYKQCVYCCKVCKGARCRVNAENMLDDVCDIKSHG